MNNDDRDYYRTQSDQALLFSARREGVTVELGIVLAERLSALRCGEDECGHFQPRSNRYV